MIKSVEPWVSLIVVVAVGIAMLYGLYKTFERMKEKQQGLGPNSLKAIGIVLFIPGLVMLAVATNFQSETLAALLGTVAGYVLSNSEPPDR